MPGEATFSWYAGAEPWRWPALGHEALDRARFRGKRVTAASSSPAAPPWVIRCSGAAGGTREASEVPRARARGTPASCPFLRLRSVSPWRAHPSNLAVPCRRFSNDRAVSGGNSAGVLACSWEAFPSESTAASSPPGPNCATWSVRAFTLGQRCHAAVGVKGQSEQLGRPYPAGGDRSVTRRRTKPERKRGVNTR